MRVITLNSYQECRVRNHQVGLDYLDLGQKTKDLATRFAENAKTDIDNTWNFNKLHDLYQNLSERFADIGNRLVVHNS